jgi:hypothetical protein
VRDADFGKALVDAVLSDLSNLPAQRQLCIDRVAKLRQHAHVTLGQIDDWLHQNLD